LVSKVAA
jgi:glyoxylase I family protein